jgi:hypothetical protein
LDEQAWIQVLQGNEALLQMTSTRKKMNVVYQNDFIKCYFNYEHQSYRWIEMPEDEAGRLIAEKKVHEGFGYQYFDPLMGERMVEYHVDNSEHLFERAGELYPEFGGLLSFHMKPCKQNEAMQKSAYTVWPG